MKYLWSMVALLITASSFAAPANNGLAIKQELMNRVVILQTLIKHYFPEDTIALENYVVGDKSSTAILTVNLVSPTRQSYTNQIKLDISHTPPNGLALVSGSIPLGKEPQPALQFDSIIDNSSPDWAINFNIAPQHEGQIINWDGLSSTLLIRIKDSKILATSQATIFKQLAVNFPGRLQFTLMPITYKSGSVYQDTQLKNLIEQHQLSSDGLQVYNNDQVQFGYKSLLLDAALNVKDDVIHSNAQLTISNITLSQMGELKSIPKVNIQIKLDNLIFSAILAYQALRANNQHPSTEQVLAAFTTTSSISINALAETSLGNFTLSAALSLNTVPKATQQDIFNATDAVINISISKKLLDAIVNQIVSYIPKSQASSQPQELVNQAIKNLIAEGMIVQTNDGYSFSFSKNKQQMLLNGNAQNPYIEMIRKQGSDTRN